MDWLQRGDILGHISIYDHKAGEEWQVPRQMDGVESLTFFNNGKWLATADRGGAIQLHPLDRDPKVPGARLPILGEPLRWIAHEGRAIAITATPDGKRLVTGGRDGLVRVWTPDVHALRWYAYSDFNTTGVTVASNDRFYVTGRCISAWDLKKRRQIYLSPPANPHWEQLAASVGGRWLAAVRRGELALFDGQTHEKVRSWSLPKELDPHRLAISPDGQMIAVRSHEEKVVHLYLRDSSKGIREFPASQCYALTFSPNGRWLAAGHMDDLRLFDLNTPSEFRSLRGHTSTLAEASFSPDGKQLATVSHDRLLKTWSIPDGRERFSIVAHQDRVKTLAFSPDGRTIATAGYDGQVKFWHSATGQPLGTLPPEGTRFHDIKFTPDGKRLVGMLNTAKFVVYDAPLASLAPTSPAIRQPVVKFHPLGDLPGGERSQVEAISPNGRFVAGFSISGKHFKPVIWSEEHGLRFHPLTSHGATQRSRATAISDDGRIVVGGGSSPWCARIRRGGGPAEAIGPPNSNALDVSADGAVIVGNHRTKDQYRAFRYQNDQITFLPPSSSHKYTTAIAVTSNGQMVLGRAYEMPSEMRRKKLLAAQLMQDVRPVIWTNESLEFLQGFNRDYQWWSEDISDDGNVVVGVSWPQGHNFFGPEDYRSGVAFHWEAGRSATPGNSRQSPAQPGICGLGRRPGCGRHLFLSYSLRLRFRDRIRLGCPSRDACASRSTRGSRCRHKRLGDSARRGHFE